VALAAERIAEIGRIANGAQRVVDAADCVVAPGFIAIRIPHYDAQICWDPAITPSSWHGVTTVVMGNCGVGIAPCRPSAREIAMRDLVNVEPHMPAAKPLGRPRETELRGVLARASRSRCWTRALLGIGELPEFLG